MYFLKLRTLAFALLLFVANSFAADIVELTGRVTDVSGLLAEYERQKIEKKLADYEAHKGSQIVVVIIPTTSDISIEDYGIRLAEDWRIGREGIDDGVILLIANNDRELRIEVGYALEGVIPDATAKRIIDDYIVPSFKNGDFAGGINKGLDKIMAMIDGEQLPEPEDRYVAPHYSAQEVRMTIGAFLMLFSVIGVLVLILFIKKKKSLFLKTAGITALSFLVGALLAGSIALAVFFIVFVLGFIFILRLIVQSASKGNSLKAPTRAQRSRTHTRKERQIIFFIFRILIHIVLALLSQGSSSSYRSNSFGSSSSRSSSFGSSRGSSSFRGGGGKFGGGGASGSW